MSAVFKQVIQNIGELNSDEKALIAHCLISSLESKHDDNVDQAWGELARDRFSELESGSIKTISWENIKESVLSQMLNVEFHPDVALEIKSSYQWYERQADGLGQNYLSELESSLETISELPETWPRFQFGFRRFLLSKFPFSIIYKASENTVHVVAVMHNSRKPGYWNKRK